MSDAIKEKILEDVNGRSDWSAIYDSVDTVPEEFISEFIEFIDMRMVFKKQRMSPGFMEEYKDHLGDLYTKYKSIYALADLDARGDDSVLLDLVEHFAFHNDDRSRLYRYVSRDSHHINQIFVNLEAEDLKNHFEREFGNNIAFNVFQRAAQFNLDIYETFFNGLKSEVTKSELVGIIDDLRKKHKMYEVALFTSSHDAYSDTGLSYINLQIEPVEGVGDYPLGISVVVDFEVSPICLRDN